MTDSSWKIFDIEKIKSQLTGRAVEYQEFLRVPSLSCGVYHLPAGSQDMQKPHDEDEVYYVISGKARMMVGEDFKEVRSREFVFSLSKLNSL